MSTQLTEAEINALKLKADKYERRLVYNNQKVKEYNAILKAQLFFLIKKHISSKRWTKL